MVTAVTSQNFVSPTLNTQPAEDTRMVSIAVLQMAVLLQSYKMFKEMTRDDWTWIRDFAEKQVMDLADKAEKQRTSQALWTLIGGVAGGVLKVGSAVVLGVSVAKPDIKWLESASKGAFAFGEISSSIGQGGAALEGAHAAKTDALYEASKRLEDSLQKMRQASQSGHELVMNIVDQLIRGWQQRSF